MFTHLMVRTDMTGREDRSMDEVWVIYNDLSRRERSVGHPQYVGFLIP